MCKSYTAIKGCGAFMNGCIPLNVSHRKSLKEALIGSEYGSSGRGNVELIEGKLRNTKALLQVPVHGVKKTFHTSIIIYLYMFLA